MKIGANCTLSDLQTFGGDLINSRTKLFIKLIIYKYARFNHTHRKPCKFNSQYSNKAQASPLRFQINN